MEGKKLMKLLQNTLLAILIMMLTSGLAESRCAGRIFLWMRLI